MWWFSKKILQNTKKATSIPIWQITQSGSSLSVKWIDFEPNPRFSVYDPAGDSNPEDPATLSDDIVLDKETGLVWERSPSTDVMTWYAAIAYSYQKILGDRMGWRLPTIEELAPLADLTQNSETHPFQNLEERESCWSSTTSTSSQLNNCAICGMLNHPAGTVVSLGSDKSGNWLRSWCVRGGKGYNAY